MKILLPILLASAALTSPALAQTAPPAPAITADQINALQAQIQALQAQVNQLQTVQAATAAQVASAPAPVAVAVAPVVEVPGWIKGTKIGGKAYLNVSHINHRTDGTDLADTGTQADVKRFYLTVDHKFDNIFSANLTTDFRYNSNGTSNDVLVYVKKAYLQATLSPHFFVRIGSADLPWVPFVEDVYGYRFVENVLIDRTKFGTSADYGVHIGGTFGNGLVSYAASAINGAGYKTLSRSSNTIDLSGRISVKPVKNIVLGVGAYSGKLGKSSEVVPDYAVPHRATRFDALAAFTSNRIRAGVEYFHAEDWKNVTTPFSDSADGYSAFGSFAFTPKLSAFGRYDWVKPNKQTNPALKDHYFNVGLDYKPIGPIDMALVYKRDRGDNGFIATSNGTIGGLDQGTYDEFGLFTQLKF